MIEKVSVFRIRGHQVNERVDGAECCVILLSQVFFPRPSVYICIYGSSLWMVFHEEDMWDKSDSAEGQPDLQSDAFRVHLRGCLPPPQQDTQIVFCDAAGTFTSTLAEFQRVGFTLRQLQIVFRHSADEFLKTDSWFPIQFTVGPGRIAEQEIHFRRP